MAVEQIQHLIQVVLAPVVLISANGLICLALFNRLSALTNRARTFHKEWFDIYSELAEQTSDEAESNGTRHLNERIKILDAQWHRMIARARLLRNSLCCLLITVLAMLGCSMALGLASVAAAMGVLALVLFYGGVLVMMTGIVLALIELVRALDPLKMEHAMIHEIDRDDELL